MENGYDFKQFEVAVFFEAFNSSEYDIGHMGCAEAQYLVFWDDTPTAHIETLILTYSSLMLEVNMQNSY